MAVAFGPMEVFLGALLMVLGIDPGREKIGWALVEDSGGLLLSGIFAVADAGAFFAVFQSPGETWEAALGRWTLERPRPFRLGSELSCVALGKGTGCSRVRTHIERWKVKTILVDERGTTLAARGLYWRLHKPSFWQRFLPPSLRVPLRPLDDLAAWGIVLRVLETKESAVAPSAPTGTRERSVAEGTEKMEM